MHHMLASGKLLQARCYQMLMNVKKPKLQSLIPKPFRPSGGSSRLLEKELMPANETGREMAPSHAPPEIRASQQLLAQIAVRILAAKVQRTHEYRAHKSDASVD